MMMLARLLCALALLAVLTGVSATQVEVGAEAKCHPECRWQCDDPMCPAICHPVCERPRCQMQCQATQCAKCTVHCEKPICSVRCPKNMCEKETCPKCETVCQPAQCHTTCKAPEPVCSPACEETRCDWKCRKPEQCPRPKCQLQCQKSACEAVKTKCCGCSLPTSALIAIDSANRHSAMHATIPHDREPMNFLEVVSTAKHHESRGGGMCCPCA